MVLGIIREADRNTRIQMENHLVSDLKSLGYNAFSAYEEYGPKMFQNMTYHSRIWGYYYSLNTRVGEPGYYQVTTKYFWESNLYDLIENKLLFSVQTQSYDPPSADASAHQYGQKIIQSIVKHGVLQPVQQRRAI